MGDGSTVKKERFDGTQVEVLDATYEPGSPAEGEKHSWEEKLGQDRVELIRYLKSGMRYWYSDDWFGSEKRKTPA